MTSSVFNTLMRRVHNGDISAMALVYEEYYKKLQVVAVRILKETAAAEDAASQTFVDLIRDAQNGKIKKVKYVSGYLCTRCKNIALKVKERNSIFESIENVDDLETVDLIDRILDGSDMVRAIAKLKDVEKEIGLMFYVYGYKIKEISIEQKMPEGTVKWHISNIKEKISKYFT